MNGWTDGTAMSEPLQETDHCYKELHQAVIDLIKHGYISEVSLVKNVLLTLHELVHLSASLCLSVQARETKLPSLCEWLLVLLLFSPICFLAVAFNERAISVGAVKIINRGIVQLTQISHRQHTCLLSRQPFFPQCSSLNVDMGYRCLPNRIIPLISSSY